MQTTYELTLVFPIEPGKGLKTKVTKLIKDFVKKKKGEVNKTDSWGVMDLAYQIDKNRQGDYEHYVLTLDPADQPKLDKELRLTEGILRYLFVRV